MKINKQRRVVSEYTIENIGVFKIYNVSTIGLLNFQAEYQKIEKNGNKEADFANLFTTLVTQYTDCENTPEELMEVMTFGELMDISMEIINKSSESNFIPAPATTKNTTD